MSDAMEGPSLSVETARALLRHLMEWDSEESCCARWTSGNEYRLWSQAARDPVVAGRLSDFPPYQWLRDLAVVAGGWWVWPDEKWPSEGPWFLSMAEWLPIYEERRQKLIKEHGPTGWAAGLPLAEEKNRAFWKAFQEEQEALEKLPKARPVSRETGAARLLRVMEDESEFNWATAWSPGHEYMLWASVVGDEPEAWRGSSGDPDALKQLSKAANGWFAWSSDAKDVEFVPMGEWLVRYWRHREELKGDPNETATEAPQPS